MPRKPALPNIDEEALGALARQFPSTVVSALRQRDNVAPAPTSPAEPPASPPEHASPDPSPSPSEQTSPPKPSLTVSDVSPPPRTPRRGGRGLAGLALLTALLALGVAATAVLPDGARTWIKQRIADPTVADALTGGRVRLDSAMAADAAALKTLENRAVANEARLAAIEAVGGSSNAAARRIDAVEAGVRGADTRIAANEAAGTAAAAQIDKLRSAVDALDTELKAAETRITAAAEAATNDALKPRLAAVEGGVANATRGSRVARFLFACLELRHAAQSSRPFERELTAAQSVADDNPDLAAALKTLSGYAAIGVPTAADLRDDFSLVVMPRVLAVSGVGQRGMAERTLAWVTSWFTSPGPVTPGERNAALVQQAVRDLQRDQLAPAVEHVLLLEDQSALIAANWLRTASGRLAVDKAVAAVMAQGFDRLVGSTR